MDPATATTTTLTIVSLLGTSTIVVPTIVAIIISSIVGSVTYWRGKLAGQKQEIQRAQATKPKDQ